MAEENYARENDIHSRYKEEIGRRTVSEEEARKRISRVEQFAAEGFFPLIIDGEAHPYIYTR